MPQLQLPIFPAGAREINSNIAVQCKDGKVVYFHGHLPVFQHEESSVNPTNSKKNLSCVLRVSRERKGQPRPCPSCASSSKVLDL